MTTIMSMEGNVLADTAISAKDRYMNSLEMILTKKKAEEGKAARINYLAGKFEDAIRRKEERVIAMIPVKYLAVCRLYQTVYRTNRDIKQLESNFDWNLFGTAIGTLDLEAGAIILVDGQARTNVVIKKEGKEAYVPVTVILKVPADYADRIKFEARLFTDQNKATRSVSHNEKLEGLSEQGDMSATILLEMLKEYGIARTTYGGALPANSIRDTNVYKRFIGMNGRAGAKWLFDVYKYSGFHAHPSSYCRQFAKAFMHAYNNYPAYREEIKEFLITYLRGNGDEHKGTKTPQNLTELADAAGYAPAKARKYLLYLEDVYKKEVVNKVDMDKKFKFAVS